MTTLYHYTCDDFVTAIRESGVVRPGRGPIRWSHYAWFTDMDQPDRDALGLTSQILDCDRTAHRFRATNTLLLRPASAVIANIGEHLSGDVARWWISPYSVSVEYDPIATLARCDWCAEQVPADELTNRECSREHCDLCSWTEGCLPCQRDMQADVR